MWLKITLTFKNKVEAHTGGEAAGTGNPELIKIFQCCTRIKKKIKLKTQGEGVREAVPPELNETL